MADEKRMATFEWLSQNLTNCKKGTPPTTKKCVTKGELLTNYNVDSSLLSDSVNEKLIPREKCICLGGDFNSEINTLEWYDSGHILVGGNFTKYRDLTYNRIIKLDLSFNIDNSFNIGEGFNNTIIKIERYKNGFLVCGAFTSYKNETHNRLILLNSSGNVDSSFNIGTGFDKLVRDFYIQDDSKVVLTGDFINVNGVTKNGIVRLNSDGSIDSSFNTGTGFPVSQYMGDCVGGFGEYILLGGEFNAFNGVSKNRLVLLNKIDGSINQNFTPPYISLAVSSIKTYNNKFIIGGRFSKKIKMLNLDGSEDTSFNVGTGFNNDVSDIYIKGTDMYVAGDFTTYNSQDSYRIIGIDFNGNIKNKFNTITDGLVATSLLMVNQLIVGGYFTQPSINLTKYTIVQDA